MGTVAKRRVFRMLARAPGHGFGLGDFRLLWSEARAFVRAVTERLGLGTPARTPPIGAGLDLLDDGKFLEDGRFNHSLFGFSPKTRLISNLEFYFARQRGIGISE